MLHLPYKWTEWHTLVHTVFLQWCSMSYQKQQYIKKLQKSCPCRIIVVWLSWLSGRSPELDFRSIDPILLRHWGYICCATVPVGIVSLNVCRCGQRIGRCICVTNVSIIQVSWTFGSFDDVLPVSSVPLTCRSGNHIRSWCLCSISDYCWAPSAVHLYTHLISYL